MSEQPAADLFPWLHPLRVRLSSLSHPVFVAFSGGLDSTVLLHEVVSALGASRVTAVHVNHGLSPHADFWQQHCANICKQLGCEYFTQNVCVERRGDGLEAAAREARYEVFIKCLESGGYLLMGHHAHDQTETILLNLFRGSGVSGLSGMPLERTLGNGKLIRPMLAINRQDIAAYADYKHFNWIEDESNDTSVFDRNFLRLEILPLLRERFPHIDNALAVTAQAMAEADELLAYTAKQTLDIAVKKLAVADLKSLTDSQQNNVLREWFNSHSGQRLTRETLLALKGFIASERQDAINAHEQAGWMFYCQRGYLFMTSKTPEFDPEWRAQWDLKAPLETPVGIIKAEPIAGGWQFPETVDVGFRLGGEKIDVLGRQCNKLIKTLLKELDIPAWQRSTLPLIYADNKVLAVADITCSERCKPEPDKIGYRITWLPNNVL